MTFTPKKYYKGKSGKVDIEGAALEVTQFEYGAETDVESFASSETEGFKVTIDGNEQASGSLQGKLSEEQVLDEVIKNGDLVGAKLYLTKVNSVNKKVYLDATVRISNIRYSVDPNAGTGSAFTCDWVSHGSYEYKNEAA